MSLIEPVQAKLLAGEAILLQRTSQVVRSLIDIQCASRAARAARTKLSLLLCTSQAGCCTVGLLLCNCLLYVGSIAV
jgi:hypothetical protein